MRPATLAEATRRIVDGTPQEKALPEFLDTFYLASTNEQRLAPISDGPAASGKGTLGKRLAAHFGLRHLDTGLIYRAVAKSLLDAGYRLDDQTQAVAAARALDPAGFDESALKSHMIGEAASIVSAFP